VEWFANGKPIPGLSLPSETWPPTALGEVRVSASSTFKVVTPEELSFPAVATVNSSGTLLQVYSEVKSWSLTEVPDYLHNLGYADKTLAAFVSFYEKDKIVWSKNSGGIATKPMAVGIARTVVLEADFSQKRDDAYVRYAWIRADNTVATESRAFFNGLRVSIPTPEVVGEYRLRVRVFGSTEDSLIGPVFVVWKIESNHDKKFFDECLHYSTVALSGSSIASSPKELVDRFYEWWWTQPPSFLRYYVPGSSDVIQVILKRGGMCDGLGNYFYKCVECQGVDGIHRIYCGLVDRPFNKSMGKSESPDNPEFWGALVATAPGLGRLEPQQVLPDSHFTASFPYRFSPPSVVKKSLKIPISPANPAAITVPDDVTMLPKLKCYYFLARDGHAFFALDNFEDLSQTQFIYDPSLLKNDEGGMKITKIFYSQVGQPENFETIISFSPVNPVFQEFYPYFSRRILYFRTFTRFIGSTFPDEKRVFDIKPENINYLELVFRAYNSSED
jgi:hypothetical protein